jgi:Fe2+ transport system protein FeoA
MDKASNSDSTTLDTIALGETCVVRRLANTGAERDRLMDLGILPGTRIGVEMVGPLGDPVAYRIRGALIALRSEQSRLIHVLPDTSPVTEQLERK